VMLLAVMAMAVLRGTSGICAEHSRMASGVHARCCSGVPGFSARALIASVRAKMNAPPARPSLPTRQPVDVAPLPILTIVVLPRFGPAPGP
jgi:hypothetical protein